MDPKTLSVLATLYFIWVMSYIRKPKRIKKKDWESVVNPQLTEAIYEEHSNNSSFYEDNIRPVIDNNKGLFNAIISFLKIDYDEVKAKVYRGSHKLTADELVAMKVGSLIIGASTIFVSLVLGASSFLVIVLILITTLGFVYPTLTLNEAVERRKQKIRKELPEFLDLLYVLLEVGTPIQDAIIEVADGTNDDVGHEFKRAALASKYMGGQYVVALEEMADRLLIEEISNLVSSIKIATEKGTPLTSVLKDQSRNIRFAQSQEYEERAARLTVRMIPIMVIFILLPMMGILLLPTFFQ